MLRNRAVAIPSEAADFADELQRLFADISRSPGAGALSGECSPALDVFETDETVEITVDLPSVEANNVRVLVKGDAVLIAGEKTPRRSQGDSSFHLVERGYGRFARVVRLVGACDTGGARARLKNGELRVTLPKITDRRGHTRPIPVAHEQPVA